MTKTQIAVANKNINLSIIAILAGWGLTIAAIVWQVAVKDATYTSRLDFIEGELTAVDERLDTAEEFRLNIPCLLYTSPSPRDRQKSRMPSSA